MMQKEFNMSTKYFSTALYQIQGCDITLNFYGIYLCHKHNCDISNPWVCWALGLFYIMAPISVTYPPWLYTYTYILSMTSQHTLLPILTTAPLDRASLVPSKFPFLEDSNSKVS